MKKQFFRTLLLSSVIASSFCLTACGHEHTYKEEWLSDATHHWHLATCEHEDEKGSYAEHTFTNDADMTCNTCGYDRTPAHTHTYSKSVTGYDENGSLCSWVVCDCSEKGTKTVIVEGVSQTNATLKATATESGTVSSTYTEGKGFNEVVAALNARCESGNNTKTLKSMIGEQEKMGLSIGGKIKLTEDIVVGYNGNTTLGFWIVENTTIDLNGHSITQQCGTDGLSGYGLFVVKSGVTLNIIDSSESHDGFINAVSVAIELKEDAVANLYDGTIKCGATMTEYDVTPADDPLGIWTISFAGGTFNQYGGKIDTVATRPVRGGGTYTHTKWNYALQAFEGKTGTVNIYGGEMNGEVSGVQVKIY